MATAYCGGVSNLQRGDRPDLMADCANCFGLCCVALAFARSADFAFDKTAGEACRNLDDDFGCSIHPHLRDRGFKGCTVFDCFGAGQKVSQRTFAGTSWRQEPDSREKMFRVFPAMRRLHELLWYLDEALRMPAAAQIHPELLRATAEIEALTGLPAERILATDIDAVLAPIAALLRQASELTRATTTKGSGGAHLAPGADLLGADLAGRDLRGAALRGALLIAADLRGTDLCMADLIGADLRDADLSGANLRTAIYVTQVQLNAARGDVHTQLPATLSRPAHWRT